MSLDLTSVGRLKRRVYLIISVFALITALIGLLVYVTSSEPYLHRAVEAVLVVAAVYHLGTIYLLLQGRVALSRLELPLILVTAVVIFTLLGHALYADYPGRVAELTVIGMYLWLPVLYAFIFLAIEVPRALPLSLFVLGFTVAFTLPHAVETAAGRGLLDGFSTLGNVYLSHGVLITTIFFLATFQRRMIRAEAEAVYMQRLAFTDALTGIANRRQMEQLIAAELTREQRYQRPFAVALLDIDDFKVVNDTHGHDVGDQVLVALVERTSGTVRASDRLGRWGGEEFIVLAPETDLEEAVALARHICERVEAEPLLPGHALTVSLGVAAVEPYDSVASILKRADEALYTAKQRGKNRVISSEDILADTQA